MTWHPGRKRHIDEEEEEDDDDATGGEVEANVVEEAYGDNEDALGGEVAWHVVDGADGEEQKNGVCALKVNLVRHHCQVHVAYLSVPVFVVHVHQATFLL